MKYTILILAVLLTAQTAPAQVAAGDFLLSQKQANAPDKIIKLTPVANKLWMFGSGGTLQLTDLPAAYTAGNSIVINSNAISTAQDIRMSAIPQFTGILIKNVADAVPALTSADYFIAGNGTTDFIRFSRASPGVPIKIQTRSAYNHYEMQFPTWGYGRISFQAEDGAGGYTEKASIDASGAGALFHGSVTSNIYTNGGTNKLSTYNGKIELDSHQGIDIIARNGNFGLDVNGSAQFSIQNNTTFWSKSGGGFDFQGSVHMANAGQFAVGIETSAPRAKLEVHNLSDGTNDVRQLMILSRASHYTVSNGFGASMQYWLENAYGVDRIAGEIRSSWIDTATNGQEKSILTFLVGGSGYLDEVLKLGKGKVIISGGLPTSPSGLESKSLWIDGDTLKITP